MALIVQQESHPENDVIRRDLAVLKAHTASQVSRFPILADSGTWDNCPSTLEGAVAEIRYGGFHDERSRTTNARAD